MEKTYDPHSIEETWYQRWEDGGYFAAQGDGDPYCIVIPPPNVTGSLHMGHAFQDTIMDTLIRYHRMKGDNTLWQPGTDHAGIATQMVVERALAAEGNRSRRDMTRKSSLTVFGTRKRRPRAPSSASSSVSVPHVTGRAAASPWTMGSARRC